MPGRVGQGTPTSRSAPPLKGVKGVVQLGGWLPSPVAVPVLLGPKLGIRPGRLGDELLNDEGLEQPPMAARSPSQSALVRPARVAAGPLSVR